MIVYTDMHIFGAHSKIHKSLTFGPDTFYIGDIVDLKNCPKSKIDEAKKLIKFISINAGENYIPGNHELAYGNKTLIKYKKVLLTHGDMFFWPQKKIVHWRGGGIKEGMAMPFWLIFWIKNYFRKLLPKKIKTSAYKRIYEIATAPAYQCHTVIIGHEHPDKIIKKTYAENNGPPVDIYILPRGRHVLDIKVD